MPGTCGQMCLEGQIWSGQVVSERKGWLLCISNGCVAGRILPGSSLREELLSWTGGPGSGPGSFTRVWARSLVTWARQQGLTWQECLALRLSFFRYNQRWANGVEGPAFCLLHSSRS